LIGEATLHSLTQLAPAPFPGNHAFVAYGFAFGFAFASVACFSS
jgi:hypothetical protein